MPVHKAKRKCTYIYRYIDQTLFSYSSSNLYVYRSEEYLGIKNRRFFRELIIIAMDNNYMSFQAGKPWLQTTMASRRKRVSQHFDDLEQCYFSIRQKDEYSEYFQCPYHISLFGWLSPEKYTQSNTVESFLFSGVNVHRDVMSVVV